MEVPTLTTADTAIKRGQRLLSDAGSPSRPSASGSGGRSSIGVLPPKQVGEWLLSGAQGVDAQGAVSLNVGQTDAPRLRHTNSVGGESVTLHTALAVKPALPRAVSGDDIDRRAHTGHGIAKFVYRVSSLMAPLRPARRRLQRPGAAGGRRVAHIAIADIDQQIAFQQRAR